MPRQLPPDDRRCNGKTKDGERCTAFSVRGEKLCAGHGGKGIASDPRGYAKRASNASVAARRERVERRRMGLMDAISWEADKRQREIVEALFAGLSVDDGAQRARCAELIVTRLHGKPVEKHEDVGRDVHDLSVEEREQLRRKLLAQFPHLEDELAERRAA